MAPPLGLIQGRAENKLHLMFIEHNAAVEIGLKP